MMPTMDCLMPAEFGSSSGPIYGEPNGVMDSHYNALGMIQAGYGESNGDQEQDNNSAGSDNHDGGGGSSENQEQDQPTRPGKRKHYRRHTQLQIDTMEAFFKNFPHPDDRQRKELGLELGLKPLQIKFWFQNKRTQIKAQLERHENTLLREENEKLRAENIHYLEALRNACCRACSGPITLAGEDMPFDGEHLLRCENHTLKQQIKDLSTAVGPKDIDNPFLNLVGVSPPPEHGDNMPALSAEIFGRGSDPLMATNEPANLQNKKIFFELAVAAMEELHEMAQIDSPLWLPSKDSTSFVLNQEEYSTTFLRGLRPMPAGFKSETSKDTTTVLMSCTDVVGMIMDVGQWSTVFSGIVSRATILEVLSAGAGNYNEALQLMNAEFQVLSPVVPTRETTFARHCKQNGDGSWGVVDFYLDPNLSTTCRRNPSGCLVQEMPNGYSKVTWIEHVDVHNQDIHHIYQPLVNSGLAFGAKRWISILERQCQRLASTITPSLLADDVSNTGRRSVLKLAERMVVSFHSGVGASHPWAKLPERRADDVRVMTRESIDDPGCPTGTVLSASTSFWLPVSPDRVFDYLRNQQFRNQWDILCNGGTVEEIAHIPTGREGGNCASLLRVITTGENLSKMLILQESGSDPTGCFVIYAPIDFVSLNVVLGGGDPDQVALLPSGFALLPDGPISDGGGKCEGAGGCLLTVAFQILQHSSPNSNLSVTSVTTINNLIACTVDRIKESMGAQNA